MARLRALLLLVVLAAAVFAEDERARPTQKRYMTPHEKMATRRYNQKTTHQKQEESYTKHMKHERTRAKSVTDKLQKFQSEGDESSNEAQAELIAEMVTVLNATVRHESDLAKEVAKLKQSEVELAREVQEIERREGDLFVLAYFELGVAALAFAAVAAVAVLRRRRGTSAAKAIEDTTGGLLLQKGGGENGA